MTEKELAEQALAGMANKALAEDAISNAARKTLTEAAEKAAEAGKDTFSLCSESSCTNFIEKEERAIWSQAKKTELREELLEKQGGKSATGKPLINGETPEIDHILPLACGGTNEISNLQLLTKLENNLKGSFDLCKSIPTSLIAG